MDIAVGEIATQPLTKTVLDGGKTALVDDTVALVDDPNVLVGSQTTPIADIRVSIMPNIPNARIRPSR